MILDQNGLETARQVFKDANIHSEPGDVPVVVGVFVQQWADSLFDTIAHWKGEAESAQKRLKEFGEHHERVMGLSTPVDAKDSEISRLREAAEIILGDPAKGEATHRIFIGGQYNQSCRIGDNFHREAQRINAAFSSAVKERVEEAVKQTEGRIRREYENRANSKNA